MDPLVRLLVPLDFSPVSEPLLRIAASISKQYSAELVLVHVIEDSIVEHVSAGYNVSLIVSELEREARKKLESFKSMAEELGARATVYDEIPVSDPAAAIAEIASEIRASEVVVASRGWGLKRLFSIGSTSKLLVKLSPVPVLFLRAYKQDDKAAIIVPEGGLFGTIAYAITGTYSEEALDYVTKLASKTKSKIILIHVREKGSGEFVDEVARKLSYRGVDVEKVVTTGRPHEAIISYAEAAGASLIFMERRVHEGIKSLFLGSTLDRVLNSSRIPVLVHPAASERT